MLVAPGFCSGSGDTVMRKFVVLEKLRSCAF